MSAQREDLDIAIKEITKEHSDSTFLSYPWETGQKVIIYQEGTDGGFFSQNQIEKAMKTAKYRHILNQDDVERIPFANL